jgi:hypothetical protein
MTLAELNVLFERLGASDALNLDGGGSSAMVAVSGGLPRLLSVPIHTGVPGRERPSANHLGVQVSARSVRRSNWRCSFEGGCCQSPTSAY